MNTLIDLINSSGDRLVGPGAEIFVQSSLLIVALAALDFVLRRRARAAIRYGLWLLVLAKLIMPPTFAAPTGIAYWLRQEQQPVRQPPPIAEPTNYIVRYSDLPASPLTPLPALPVAIAGSPLNRNGFIFGLWFTVAVGLFCWMGRRALMVNRRIAAATLAPPEVLELLENCRRDFGIKRTVRLRISKHFGTPAICGIFKPTILLPGQLTESLTGEQLQSVLIHELAHLQRGDLLVNYAQTLLQIVYWWHPLVWLANSRIRRAREQAVDEMVMLQMGESAAEYPATLVQVARFALARPALALNLVGIMESETALKERVNRLINDPIPRKARLGVMGLVTVMVSGAVMVPMGRGQNTSQTIQDSLPLNSHTARESSGGGQPGSIRAEDIPILQAKVAKQTLVVEEMMSGLEQQREKLGIPIEVLTVLNTYGQDFLKTRIDPEMYKKVDQFLEKQKPKEFERARLDRYMVDLALAQSSTNTASSLEELAMDVNDQKTRAQAFVAETETLRSELRVPPEIENGDLRNLNLALAEKYLPYFAARNNRDNCVSLANALAKKVALEKADAEKGEVISTANIAPGADPLKPELRRETFRLPFTCEFREGDMAPLQAKLASVQIALGQMRRGLDRQRESLGLSPTSTAMLHTDGLVYLKSRVDSSTYENAKRYLRRAELLNTEQSTCDQYLRLLTLARVDVEIPLNPGRTLTTEFLHGRIQSEETLLKEYRSKAGQFAAEMESLRLKLQVPNEVVKAVSPNVAFPSVEKYLEYFQARNDVELCSSMVDILARHIDDDKAAAQKLRPSKPSASAPASSSTAKAEKAVDATERGIADRMLFIGPKLREPVILPIVNFVIQIDARYIEFPSNQLTQFFLGEPTFITPAASKQSRSDLKAELQDVTDIFAPIFVKSDREATPAAFTFNRSPMPKSKDNRVRFNPKAEFTMISTPRLLGWELRPEQTARFLKAADQNEGISVWSAPRILAKSKQEAEFVTGETNRMEGAHIRTGPLLRVKSDFLGDKIETDLVASITQVSTQPNDNRPTLQLNQLIKTVRITNGSTVVLYPEGARLADGNSWLLVVTAKAGKTE